MQQTLRHAKRQQTRTLLWAVFHHGRGRTGHAFNFLLVILILISAALVPVEYFPTFGPYTVGIHILEAVIIGIFTLEYLLRIYAAPQRLRYIFSFFGLVDLVSIIPFYVGIFGIEAIRLLRLIRLFKLAEIESAAENEEADAMQRGMQLVEGETVEYVVTKSPVVLFLGVIPPLIALTFGIGLLLLSQGNVIGIALAISLFLFALIFLWKAWLDFSYDVLYVTNLRLIFQNQHMLGRSINQVQYAAITNIKPFYPSSLSYILRYGTLIIDTAAETPGQIMIDMVRRHEHAAHVIMQKSFAAQQLNGTRPPFNGMAAPPSPAAVATDLSAPRP